METTLLATVLRPYSSGSAVEIKSQPKVYGFDTGFVCYFKSIDNLRDEDRGHLLEHLVLGELQANFEPSQIFYWRNKQKLEIDFIIKPSRSKDVIAIEVKCNSSKFNPSGLSSFRSYYPKGSNFVVSLNVTKPEKLRVKGLEVTFIPFKDFGKLCKLWGTHSP